MKNKKLISAILAAASIAGGVVGAQAADTSTLEAKVDSYTSRVQQAEQKIEGLQTKVDALDTTGIADNKAGIEANKNAIATQGAQISQIQQDMAQDAMDRANEMGDLTAKVNKKADKADVEQNKNDIASNAVAIQTETQKREDAVKGLQDKLTVANGQIENEKTTRENADKAEATARENADTKLQENINAEATARENAVNDLQNQVTTNKNAIATQGAQISQIQQDMAQDAMDRADEMNKLTTKVNQKADKADVEANKNDIASNAAAIKTETQKREEAVKGLQDKLTVANGQIENEKTTRENAVNDLQNQVTANKGDIADLQHKIVASGQAFNADQVDQIAKNKNDIGTIFGQLDQGEYNTQDGYAIKKNDTIGGALKNLDKNAEKQGAQISQIQQDMAQDAMDRANEMSDLTAKVNKKADKGDVEQNKNDIASNAAAIQKETQKREDAVKGLKDQLTITNGQLENEKTTRENADKTLQDNIDKETGERKAADKTLQDNIDKETGERKAADKTLQDNIDKETAARIAGDNALNSRINQVESDANKGIAKASALAALHPLDYDPDNKFDIAAAGGFYKGENAFALGAFYRPNRNVMLSMGTTLTSGDNAYNVGLTFKIGKSGKHTEAGLTTADLYAMIGAMQDKMDQQQKKIEELEAKQAK